MEYVSDQRLAAYENWPMGPLFVSRKLICQSGVWAKSFKLEEPRVVYGPFGNINGDVGIAFCENEELVVGGGANCSDPARGYIHSSYPVDTPQGQGWVANCFGVPGYPDPPAQAFAVCMKKQ